MKLPSDTRERILAVATDLFARYGFTKTALDEIARGAGLAKGTIYYYFPSKEDLFLSAIEVKAEELFSSLMAKIEESPAFEDKLSCFLRLPMKYIFDHMPILAEALRQIPQNYFEKMEENRRDYRRRMNEILTKIMDQGKAEGIINENVDSSRFSQIINDWFLMGDSWIDIDDKDRIIRRIERDHELIIQLLLYGIVQQRPQRSLLSGATNHKRESK